MAVVPEVASKVENKADGNQITLIGFNPSGANRFAFIGIAMFKSNTTVSSVTRTGDTPVFIGRRANTTDNQITVEIWKIVAPVTGSANVVINLSQSDRVTAFVINYNGVDQTTPNDAFQSDIGKAINPSLNVTSETGDFVTDVVGIKETNLTVGAGQTLRMSQNEEDLRGRGSDETGSATVTMSWSGSSGAWAHGAININGQPTETFTVDALLFLGKVFVSIDARVGVFVKEFVVDAFVQKTKKKKTKVEGLLQKQNNDKTFTIDGIPVIPTSEIFGINALVKAFNQTKTFTVDAEIASRNTKTFAIDAILTNRPFTINALLSGGLGNKVKQIVKITDTYGPDVSTQDFVISPALTDTTKALAFISFRHAEQKNSAFTVKSWEIINSTTLRLFGRGDLAVGNASIDFIAYIIEFTGDLVTQQDIFSIGATSTKSSIETFATAISPQNSSIYYNGENINKSESGFKKAFARVRILDSTTWEWEVSEKAKNQDNRISVVDWHDLEVKSQRGQATLLDNFTSVTIIPPNSFDRTRTILHISYRLVKKLEGEEEESGDKYTDNRAVSATINASNQIVVTREGMDKDLEINWEITEFPKKRIKVEYNSITQADLTSNSTATVNEVNTTARSFVISPVQSPFGFGNGRVNANDTDDEDVFDRSTWTLDLENSTTVRAIRGDGTDLATVEFMVIQICGINTKTFTVDARLSPLKEFTVDAIVVNRFDETFDVDARLAKRETFEIDGCLQAVKTKTFDVDSIVVDRNTETFTVDALIQAINQEETFTVDAFVQKTQTETFDVDAFVQATQTETFTVDGILQATFTQDFLVDAFVQATQTETFTVDGILQATFTFDFTIDALLQATQTKTFTVDAFIQALNQEKTFTVDAILKATFTETFLVDAFIQALNTNFNFLVDGFIQAENQKMFLVNGLIQDTFTVTINDIDAIISQPSVNKNEPDYLLVIDETTLEVTGDVKEPTGFNTFTQVQNEEIIGFLEWFVDNTTQLNEIFEDLNTDKDTLFTIFERFKQGGYGADPLGQLEEAMEFMYRLYVEEALPTNFSDDMDFDTRKLHGDFRPGV